MSYRFGTAELRPQQRMLLVGGKDSHIGARAFDLLMTLVEHRERVVEKNELLDAVWPGLVVEENNLQVQISTLRKVLGAQAIATVPGRGYRFTGVIGDYAARASDEAHSLGPNAGASGGGREAPANNLPAALPRLVGRERDLENVHALLRAHRLVTLAGPVGIGKTSLAQAVAQELAHRFDDGVWLVDLSPVAQPELVATTVGTVLKLRLRPDAQPQALAESIGRSRMLLVLDSCEHVSQAVAEIAAAVHRLAPGVSIITTSQAPLRIAAEQVYRLSGLAAPPASSVVLEQAREFGALALFEARVRAADPWFAFDATNVKVAADICRRLDGIPVAIELAAARVPLLGVEGVRERLNERFRVLRGGSRSALPRHRTLHAALEWSHSLLTDHERAVFRRLGVFSGSFRLDSAQAVAAMGSLENWAVIDAMGSLVDKSLLVAEPGAHPRYRLLESHLALAQEKLAEAGELDAVRRAHAHAVRAVFEESWEQRHLLTRQERQDRYLPDLDDARAALDWSATEDPALHVALAGTLAWLWPDAGLRTEGMARSRRAMALMNDSMDARDRARLLLHWPALALPETGQAELAAAERAVQLFRECGERMGLFTAECDRARVLSMLSRIEEADAALKEAEALWSAAWPPATRMMLQHARGWVANFAARSEEAITHYEAQYRAAQALGDRRVAIVALINIEQAVSALGRTQEAVARGRELMALMEEERALCTCSGVCVLYHLCMALLQLGETQEALAVARKADPGGEPDGSETCTLDALALLAFQRGFVEDAARIFGHAESRRQGVQLERQPVEARVVQQLEAGLAAALPPARLQALMHEGAALTRPACAHLALRD